MALRLPKQYITGNMYYTFPNVKQVDNIFNRYLLAIFIIEDFNKDLVSGEVRTSEAHIEIMQERYILSINIKNNYHEK